MNRYHFDDTIHLHTLDGKPLTGVSTVGDIMAKNLTWWSAELAAVECLESGIHIPTIREEYLYVKSLFGLEKKRALDALQKKYPIFKAARYAHKKKKEEAAGKGTDRHAEVEKWVKGRINGSNEEAHPDILPFVAWSKENVKKFLFSEIHCYSEKLWCGGVADIGVVLKDDAVAVVDIKSSEDAFSSQFFQVGGYDTLLSENGGFDAEGNKTMEPIKVDAHIVFPFGMKEPTGVIRYDVEDNRKAFIAEVILYRQDKKISNK